MISANPQTADDNDLSRILALSDGVFAFALTLLVTSFFVPTDLSLDQVPAVVFEQLPTLTSYVTSFVVIGGFWYSHHQKFRYIIRYNSVFLWLNLLILMTIAFLPFSTDFVGEYSRSAFAVIFYNLSLIVASLSFSLLWIYATKSRKLVRKDLPSNVVLSGFLISFSIAIVFGVSTLLALVNVNLGRASWLLAFVVPFLTRVWFAKSFL
ncbi:MAG: TMEM175 family protein [Patescibacteria group bacterium]|jgi:uncharacterized membrane protein